MRRARRRRPLAAQGRPARVFQRLRPPRAPPARGAPPKAPHRAPPPPWPPCRTPRARLPGHPQPSGGDPGSPTAPDPSGRRPSPLRSREWRPPPLPHRPESLRGAGRQRPRPLGAQRQPPDRGTRIGTPRPRRRRPRRRCRPPAHARRSGGSRGRNGGRDPMHAPPPRSPTSGWSTPPPVPPGNPCPYRRRRPDIRAQAVRVAVSRNSNLRTLPDAFRGSSSTKLAVRGTL